MHERLAKKFAHPAVDLPRPEVVVIEKNLELYAGFLVVIRQRDAESFAGTDGFGFGEAFGPDVSAFLTTGFAATALNASRTIRIRKCIGEVIGWNRGAGNHAVSDLPQRETSLCPARR